MLRAIDATRAYGQEGARVDPDRTAPEAGPGVGNVDPDCCHHASPYLLREAALPGNEHTATEVGAGQHHGYALDSFARRAVKPLEW